MALEKPMEREAGWKPLSVPELQTWDKPGTQISGKLLSAQRVEIKGKQVLQYILATGVKTASNESGRLKFLATYDLAQKLSAEHRGMLVRIKYLGEDESVKKGDNFMKVFDVMVKPDPDAPAQRDSGPITDEDIPF